MRHSQCNVASPDAAEHTSTHPLFRVGMHQKLHTCVEDMTGLEIFLDSCYTCFSICQHAVYDNIGNSVTLALGLIIIRTSNHDNSTSPFCFRGADLCMFKAVCHAEAQTKQRQLMFHAYVCFICMDLFPEVGQSNDDSKGTEIYSQPHVCMCVFMCVYFMQPAPSTAAMGCNNTFSEMLLSGLTDA
ncbi:hypothetical protein AMECASPLE_027637 [Ameca splendens]|uniref:Uncharacterized protein n=1 Tax=Ameca splendens TaxID=208324 RepID=A0ABV0YGZ9_9TELE